MLRSPRRGALWLSLYPHAMRADVPLDDEIADQLNETVINRLIQGDLRLDERVPKRDPALPEKIFGKKLFGPCHAWVGQAPCNVN